MTAASLPNIKPLTIRQLKFGIVGLYLFGLTTVVMPFYFIGINVLFFATTALSIAAILLIEPRTFYVAINKWLLLLLFVYTVSFFYNFKSERISSYAYALFFAGAFICMAANLSHLLTKKTLGFVLRILTWLFFAVIVLQQVCVVLGLPVININPEFSPQFMAELWIFRLNSLSSEPSYGATIIVIFGYVYYLISSRFKGEGFRFWFPAIYLWVFFNSALATALVPLMIFVLLAGKRWWLLPLFLVATFVVLQNVESENRIVVLLQELDIKNFADTFIDVDLSGAFRVVPMLFYAEQVAPFTGSFWLGHGIDYGSEYISRLMPGLELDFNFPGGILPFMLFDYGLLCFIAFVFFLQNMIAVGNKTVFWMMAIFVMVNANFNTQLMWIFITFMYVCKMVLAKSDEVLPVVTPLNDTNN